MPLAPDLSQAHDSNEHAGDVEDAPDNLISPICA